MESAKKCFQRIPSCEGDHSTVETFVHSLEGSAEDCGKASELYHGSDRLLIKPDGSNIDQNDPNSPEKYKQLPLMDLKENDEFVEQDVGLPLLSDNRNQYRFSRGGYLANGAVAIAKPEPGQCYIQEQTVLPVTVQQQIVNTHVCVELGVITAPGQVSDCQGDSSCPPIVLCSVNVEPCLGATIENSVGEPLIRVPQERESDKEVLSNDSQVHAQENTTQRTDIKEEKPSASVERKQPEGTDKPILPSTEAEDDMMDRISHDLDYLLNRKSTSVFTTPRKTSRPPTTSQIKEEDEEGSIGDCAVSDNVMDPTFTK